MSTDDRNEHDASSQAGDDIINELPRRAVDADDAESVKGGILGNVVPAVQLPAPNVQKIGFTGGV